ncbi:monocarboxylate transporter 9-like [Haemaphysalis longicornis]
MTTATRPESFEQKPHESFRRLSVPGPVDVLWGMGIVVTFVTLLSAIVITNAAFFYVRFRDTYDASHEMASWPLTMVALVSHLVGVPIFIYQYRFSVYRITLLGSVLTPLGLLASALAPNIGWITFTIGFIYGSGLGILMICLSIYTMEYFDQYRGTVSGLKYLGWSASGLVFPVILSALVEIYGLQGTLFLSGGLVMNIVPIVFLLRNPTHTMASSCCGFRRGFRIYALSSTYVIFEYCHIVATTNIVAYAVDKGSPLPIAESLIMYGAVASMTGRIVLPVASDTLGLKRDLLVVEVSSFLHVAILLVGEGVASGAVLAMKPVIVAEYLGVEKMTATWGIMGVFMVPVFLGECPALHYEPTAIIRS